MSAEVRCVAPSRSRQLIMLAKVPCITAAGPGSKTPKQIQTLLTTALSHGISQELELL